MRMKTGYDPYKPKIDTDYEDNFRPSHQGRAYQQDQRT